MRHVAQTLALTGSVVFLLVGCATIGPPLPPSLDLPQPPSDLRATRKGNRVNLSWTIPTLTTDRQTIRSLGLTLICRETGIENACETPVGEVKSPVVPEASSSSQKPQISYSDTLPKQLESDGRPLKPGTSLTRPHVAATARFSRERREARNCADLDG
jgi:hypothetical protein